MKILKTMMLTLFVSLAVISCKKDDDGGNAGPAGSGTVVAKINGADFQSLDIASTASQSNGGNSTTVTIQGTDANGKGIFIILNNFTGVGTYEFTDSNVFFVATYVEANVSNPQNSQTWTAPYQDSGVVGQVQVSEKTDTTIKGTFSFMGKNVNGDESIRNISDGSFNLAF